MKRLILLSMVALACAPKQETRYVRTDWPTPEEVKQDIGRPEVDSLQTFVFDSTILLEPLTGEEIDVLEAARWAYFETVKDSFTDMSDRWWSTSMRSWMYNTYDSLESAGKSSDCYYLYLCKLQGYLFFEWLKTWSQRNWEIIDSVAYRVLYDSLRSFQISVDFAIPEP